MNKIFVHGRMARDPELKTIQGKNGDTSVCNFTVATNRSFGDEADFFVCKIFGKRAEAVKKFFGKGQEIVVQGEMQCRKWKTKEDENRYSWEVNVENFDFCGSKKDGSKPVDDTPEGFTPIDDEDIPF